MWSRLGRGASLGGGEGISSSCLFILSFFLFYTQSSLIYNSSILQDHVIAIGSKSGLLYLTLLYLLVTVPF